MNDPVVDNIDRSGWRYQDGGPLLDVAIQFCDLIKSPDIGARLPELRAFVTAESWPAWERAARAGFDPQLLRELTHYSAKIRYPADGMAFVFSIVTHPDQDEPLVIETKQPAYVHVVTLVLEGDQWRVHQLGPMINPRDLGRTPYSW